MLEQTYLKLRLKKLAWLSVLTAIVAGIVLNAALSPIALLGMGLGLGAFSLSQILPSRIVLPYIITAAVAASFWPIAISFNLFFIGSFAHAMLLAPRINLDKLRDLSNKNIEDIDDCKIIDKLENKTNVKVDHKIVNEVDPKKMLPNAAAGSNLEASFLFINSNIMTKPFTKKERKAVYAHELGHIYHNDSFVASYINFMWRFGIVTSLLCFSLPAILLSWTALSFVFYATKQNAELIADCYSAKHANPKQLASGLTKIVELATPMNLYNSFKSEPDNDNQSNNKSYLTYFNECFSTHPSLETRKQYLDEYADEKQQKKSKQPKPNSPAVAA